MLLPEPLRAAVLALAALVFVVAQARLLVLASRRSTRSGPSQLRPRADTLMLAVSAALTSVLLVICARVVVGGP